MMNVSLQSILISSLLLTASGRCGNLALSRVAVHSTGTGFGGLPGRAVDGNRDGNYANSSVSHDGGNIIGSYWEVDLGSTLFADSIRIWNRTDGDYEARSGGWRVSLIGADHATEVWGQTVPAGSPLDYMGGFSLPWNAAGRYVRVTRALAPTTADGQRWLHMAEVEVYGAGSTPNIARNPQATAFQSSTAFGGVASRAVDGNVDGDYYHGNSVTHTQSDVDESYWQVALGGDYTISRVFLFNRGEHGYRLSNFRVQVLRDGVETWGQNFLTGWGGNVDNSVTDIPVPNIPGDTVRVQDLPGPNGGDSNILSLAEVKVTGVSVPLSPLEIWRQNQFGTPDNTGMAANNADPDRDGLENLIEYAFALNPHAPDTAALPVWQKDDDTYILTFTRPANVSGVTYVAEYSSSLAPGSWAAAGNAGTGNNFVFFTTASGSRLYLRLRVTVP